VIASATQAQSRLPREARPGRRLAIASLLMAPALVVSYVAAFFVGIAFQSALGLAEDELLTEAGLWSAAAAVLLIVLIDIPQIVGIVLGVKGRRLGARRLGTTGVVVNTAIAAYVLLSSVLQLMVA
jgi:hypothetical protein